MDAQDAAVCVSVTPVKLSVQISERPPILEQNPDAMTAYAQWCVRYALLFAARATTWKE
jgi:hypothetical protein